MLIASLILNYVLFGYIFNCFFKKGGIDLDVILQGIVIILWPLFALTYIIIND